MIYFGNREVSKTTFLLYGQTFQLRDSPFWGSTGITTLSQSQPPQGHRLEVCTAVPGDHHCIFAKWFRYFRWTLFGFVPVRSLVVLISCLCPSCSGSSARCWRSTRGFWLMPNYRQWRRRIWKTRRELPGWLSGFGKTRNPWLPAGCFLHLMTFFTHCPGFRIQWREKPHGFFYFGTISYSESGPSWFHVWP